jgi:hypothetical protein
MLSQVASKYTSFELKFIFKTAYLMNSVQIIPKYPCRPYSMNKSKKGIYQIWCSKVRILLSRTLGKEEMASNAYYKHRWK